MPRVADVVEESEWRVSKLSSFFENDAQPLFRNRADELDDLRVQLTLLRRGSRASEADGSYRDQRRDYSCDRTHRNLQPGRKSRHRIPKPIEPIELFAVIASLASKPSV